MGSAWSRVGAAVSAEGGRRQSVETERDSFTAALKVRLAVALRSASAPAWTLCTWIRGCELKFLLLGAKMFPALTRVRSQDPLQSVPLHLKIICKLV